MTNRLWLIALLVALCATVAPAADFYAAPDGKPAGVGSAAAPWDIATAFAPPAAVRPGDTVWLRGGVYTIRDTLALAEKNSGAAGAPVTYRAAKDETVRLVAGRTVSAADFRPVTDAAILARLDPAARGKVVRLDLAALGIQHVGPYPAVFNDGGGIIELFFGGKRMPLARWPNEGYVTMAKVIDRGALTGKDGAGGTFVYREDRPARWPAADGVWLSGFWRVPWAPETVRVKAIDAAKREITLAASVNGGIGSKYAGPEGSGKEPWCAVNLLEEIDQPGEWCVNFTAKTLYFWPPAALEGAEILISDLKAPVIAAKNASNLVLRGLIFEGGLGGGVLVSGGSGVLIGGCTFRNLGGTAVIIKGGTKHTVTGCDIHDMGCGGIYAGGGERKTLTPAGHAITNNHIWQVGRVKKTYTPPIGLGAYDSGYAAGCTVAHNLIHDVPHAAVLYGGNDNVLEFNHIYRVALDSGDVGAFYTWNDWTSRGNVVRYNFIHDSPAANGVYMDDGDSGDTVFGNVFYKLACGPFVGGGHDNLVRNNISIECPKGIHIDSRGVARGYNLQNKKMVEAVTSVNPRQPPWSTRFPELGNLLEFHPDMPTGDVIENNVVVNCPKWLNQGGKKEELQYVKIGENFTAAAGEDPGFVNAAQMDFRLRPDSAVFKKLPGFKPIPMEKIGLYVDEYRPRLPAAVGAPTGPQKGPGEVFNSETDLKHSSQPQRR
jgi:hypothetical protein